MHDANDEVCILFLCKNIFLKKKKYYQTAPRKTDSVNHKPPHRAITPIPLSIIQNHFKEFHYDCNRYKYHMLCVNMSIFLFLHQIPIHLSDPFLRDTNSIEIRIRTNESTYHEYLELCFVFGIATDLYVGDIPLAPRTISFPQNWTSMAWYGVFWTTRHHHPSLLD